MKNANKALEMDWGALSGRPPYPSYAEHYILQQDGSFGNAQILGPDEVLRLIVMDKVEISLKDVFEDSMS